MTEPEWDEQERGWMLALAIYRDSHCPGCGGLLAETTDPANESRYAADMARCHKCTAIAQSAATVAKAAYPHTILHRADLKT